MTNVTVQKVEGTLPISQHQQQEPLVEGTQKKIPPDLFKKLIKIMPLESTISVQPIPVKLLPQDLARTQGSHDSFHYTSVEPTSGTSSEQHVPLFTSCGPLYVPTEEAKRVIARPLETGELLATVFTETLRQRVGEAFTEKGMRYYEGMGGKTRDVGKAIQVFQKAVNQGYPNAQCALAILHQFGCGEFLTKDDRKAVQLYRLAAVQGHAGAQNNLGAMCEGEENLVSDIFLPYIDVEGLAEVWYKLAAKQGLVAAKINLARIITREHDELIQEMANASPPFPKWLLNFPRAMDHQHPSCPL